MVEDDVPTRNCELCGAEMALVQTTPKVGGLPELHSYHCKRCGHAKTEEGYIKKN